MAVDLLKNEQIASTHKARNPLGRVPVLEINGAVLTQSFSMLEYLEEVYPDPPLLPIDALQRAWVRALALIIVADIHPIGNLGNHGPRGHFDGGLKRTRRRGSTILSPRD